MKPAPDALGERGRLGSPPRRRLAEAVGSGALSSVSGVGLLATSAWLITRASLRPPVLLLAVAIGSVQALALARGVARYGERLAVHDLSLEMLSGLRVRLFDRLEPLVPGGLPGRRSGGLLGAFVDDTEAVGEAAARTSMAAIEAGAGVIAGLALALLVDPLAGLVLASGAVATAAAVLGGRRWHLRCGREAAAARDELSDVIVAAARAGPELVAFGREDLIERQVAAAGERAERPARRAALVTGLGRAATAAVPGTALLGVLAVGLDAHRAGRLSAVMLAVVALASVAALDTLVGLPDAVAAAANGRIAAGRIAGLDGCVALATEPRSPAPPPARPTAAALEAAVVERGGAVVLDRLSLEVGPGARVGLVGESGAGKTTAIFTLLHFLECSAGRALLGGEDVTRLAREALRDRMGWVPEEPHVFGGTLGANLRLAEPGASAEACVDALERVGLGPWLAGLPEGLDTRLGPTGRGMSAGERQRLCLARALLGDPDVLLLDEPTARLDPDGAAAVLGELIEAAEGRSVLLVAHDEEDLAHVEQVIAVRSPESRLRARSAPQPGAPSSTRRGTGPVRSG